MVLDKKTRTAPARGPDRLERKIRASRWALGFERLWPRVWLVLGVAGVFLLVSLLGLWPLLAPLAHKIVLAGFGVALLGALVWLIRVRWPSREEAVRRLERLSGVAHRPASSYDDRLSIAAGGGVSEQLWREHRNRLARLFARLRVNWPRPRVDRHDPFAARAALLLVLGLAAIVVGDAGEDRIRSAFRFGPEPVTLSQARLDAWVTPPLYTGKPPRMLADGAVALRSDGHVAEMIEVPEASEVIIRVSGADARRFSVEHEAAGNAEPHQLSRGPETDDAGDFAEFRATLKRDGRIAVQDGGREVASWRFSVLEDHPPKIKLAKPASQGARGALRLAYEVEDDYGVVSAEARIRRSETVGEGEGKGKADGAVGGRKAGTAPLFDQPPRFALRLAKPNAKKTKGTTYKDLTAHPWAGLEVQLTLIARDQAGQTGSSPPQTLLMPARNFTEPLARAVVEQRQKLYLEPHRRLRVARALNALTIAPEYFIKDKTVYLGLRSAYWRLKQNRSRKVLRTVFDQLWDIALRIEDGDLSDAERALRAAQEQLAKALSQGAPEAEIKQLMKNLRTALNRFLQSLAQQQVGKTDRSSQKMAGNNRLLRPRDLNRMLENIEKLARSGSRDAAQQMLSQLRDMLERLQSGRMANSQRSNQAMQMLEQFGELIQKQQRLLDDTYRQRRGGSDRRDQSDGRRQGQGNGKGRRQGRGRVGEGDKGQPGERGRGLAGRQGDLRGELEQLMEDLKGFGSRIPGPLNGAGRAMSEAERELEGKDLDRATQQQSLALDRLRKGAQSMAEQLLKGMTGQFGNAQRGRDPLGRPQNGRGNNPDASVHVPDEIDIQKARRILEELRRRLSEQTRPPIELDYLERLLKRF